MPPTGHKIISIIVPPTPKRWAGWSLRPKLKNNGACWSIRDFIVVDKKLRYLWNNESLVSGEQGCRHRNNKTIPLHAVRCPQHSEHSLGWRHQLVLGSHAAASRWAGRRQWDTGDSFPVESTLPLSWARPLHCTLGLYRSQKRTGKGQETGKIW